MSLSRRHLLAGGAAVATGLAMSRWSEAVAQAVEAGPVFTPEQYGAKGDGVTNDTEAFATMATAVNIAGGGTITLRKTTYIVGQQRPGLRRDAYYSYAPAPVLRLQKLTKPLRIRGNGATLRCAPGLRYGTFDPTTGEATENRMPFAGSQIATPYDAMVVVEQCFGPVEVSNLELDGNIDRLRIGGPYGDTGRQIPAGGLALMNNRAGETVRNLYTHHHGQDGLYIDGVDQLERTAPVRLISGVRSEYNGRQGCSIVGGRGYRFENCKFNHTGKSKTGVASPPGAGVDIEAENGKINRDFTFVNCEFVNNWGCGLVADTGDSEGAVFRGCTFIGATSWAAWPSKPRFRFEKCTFIGSTVRPHGDEDEARATQFHDCRFRDDPKLSPNGKIYLSGIENYPIVDLAHFKNVLFNRCDFTLTHNAVLPWSWHAIYQDCRMRQRAPNNAFPKGKYRGHSTIEANVDLYGTTVEGSLIVNGSLYRP